MSAISFVAAVGHGRDEDVIDEDHLRRMTLGDRKLECEVLTIFARQIDILLGRIEAAEPAVAAAAAHTLLGSARGIGAWRVARAAERLEECVAKPKGVATARAVEDLKAATREVNTAIAARLTGFSPPISPEP